MPIPCLKCRNIVASFRMPHNKSANYYDDIDIKYKLLLPNI